VTKDLHDRFSKRERGEGERGGGRGGLRPIIIWNYPNNGVCFALDFIRAKKKPFQFEFSITNLQFTIAV
jgi:hypothetical protein